MPSGFICLHLKMMHEYLSISFYSLLINYFFPTFFTFIQVLSALLISVMYLATVCVVL